MTTSTVDTANYPLIIVAAMDRNKVIGNEGKLPWHIRKDLEHFNQITRGHPVIMGRKTWESLPKENRPLPYRYNIVISQSKDGRSFRGAVRAKDIHDAIRIAKKHTRGLQYNNPNKIFVIGGGEIYEQALPFTREMYLTHIDHTYIGDTLFPDFPRHQFVVQSSVVTAATATHPAFTIKKYQRV